MKTRNLILATSLLCLNALSVSAEQLMLSRSNASELYVSLSTIDTGLTPSNTVTVADDINVLRPAVEALDKGKVWHMKKALDHEAMHAAAQALVGLHDFTTFRDMHCQAQSPMKTLDVARVRRVGEEIHLDFEARSFLHRQVRSMTGTLVEVGAGRWDVGDVARALEAKDRRACGPVAPADGLYLVGVGYGD